jgi:hypothetical protein
MDANEIHRHALVIDGHTDTPQRFVDEGWSFSDPLQGGMLNLDTALAGNLAASFFAIWVEPVEWRNRYAFRTLQLIDVSVSRLKIFCRPTQTRSFASFWGLKAATASRPISACYACTTASACAT